ncbi:hypothetical protein M9458_005860, partial [Cirrhinus mrigala]
MSAVTRKRRKRHNGRLLGSSTDDDSEHEPIKSCISEKDDLQEMGQVASFCAPRAEGEEDEEEEEEDEEEEEEEQKEEVVPSISSTEEAAPAVLLSEEEEQSWRGDDARSIVSGYSTFIRGAGELVSETDNESGFASRSLTQERPEKPSRSSQNSQASPEPTAPRSFLYAHCKSQTPSGAPLTPPPPSLTTSSEDPAARSSTPSTSSYSSSASQRLHSRHSFNSHRLIQCDTLARRRLKADKAKAPSVDLSELSSSSATEGERRSGSNQIPESSPSPSPKAKSFSKGVSVRNECTPISAAGPGSKSCLLSSGQGSLADQVRARLMGSADDLRSVGLRKQLSPETRRKRRAWRRHTVVVSPTDCSDKKPQAPPPKPLALPSLVDKQDVGESHPECSETEAPTVRRALPTSRFRDF